MLSKSAFFKATQKFDYWNTYTGKSGYRIELGNHIFPHTITTKRDAYEAYKETPERIYAYAYWLLSDYGKWWNAQTKVVQRELFSRHAPKWCKEGACKIESMNKVNWSLIRVIWNHHVK